MRLHVAYLYPRPFCHRFLRFSFVFTTKSIINNVAFRHILRCLRCTFRIYVATARWRNGRCRAEYGNVEGSEWRCKRPSRVRAGARCTKYVSKMTHGFFITINSMVLYFKHIIHIDDFPLNEHQSSCRLCGGNNVISRHTEGIVLAPLLFNLYTNGKTVHTNTRSFLYAHDLCAKKKFPTTSLRVII